MGLAGDVGAVWADLGQAGRSGTGEVWGCWVSLKLAGEVWGCLGSLGLGGLIWNELGESGSGWGFGAVWASLKLAGEVGEWFEAGWDAGGALSELAGGRARLRGASWGLLKSTAGEKNRFPAMHGCGQSGGILQPKFIVLKTAKN